MRKLDDIIPPSRRKETEQPLTSSAREPLRLTRRYPKFPFAIPAAIALVIVASVGALFYFSTTRVEVTPNTVSVAVQSPFTTNMGSSTQPFQVITAQKVASQSVKGSGTKAVSTSSSGIITIYNAQAKTQRLIANTRFATTAGLIFRIHEAVSIPAGSKASPGSVSAKVYADKAGDAYNVGPTSFTIPGFAGTPQASMVYARSSSAMTGGASGTVPVVDAVAESQARTALVTALAPDLLKSIEAQVPSGFILLPGAATTTYEALPSTSSLTAGQVDVKEQGSITAVVFPNASLAKAIASSAGGLGYQGEPITLTSANTLTLSATEFPSADATSFTFTLSGTASLIYTVDSTRIAAAVSGKTRTAAQAALSSYPEIKRAVLILRPFWRQTFPLDPSSISIVVEEPNR
ncbi:MAG: hypothetical protein PHV99_00710 [Candidatus Pacebacteria bacterium]|nr:hypothetical protein [Candidatus Paceibacterota bacterium]